jgi:predicted Zn-dependent protease
VRKRLIPLACALALASGCLSTPNPATGGQDFTPFMSPAKEARIGADEHPKILARFGGVYQDPAIGGYVAEVGGRVMAHAGAQRQAFRFTVLNSPQVNAFALPGGYVYVTRGLLALANSEAQLAGVLAHEVGHVVARHTAQRYNRAIFTSLGAAVLGAVTGNRLVDQLVQIGGELYLKGFSRDQEFEADTLGVRYMAGAGYDAGAQARFLAAMGSHSALERQIAGAQGRDPIADFFATHPRSEDRVQRAIAAAQGSASAAGAPRRRERYLDTIQGLIYGDDPAQGLVRGRVFSHPKLGFSFTVPPGYRLINTDQAVFAKGPNGAAIKFDGAKREDAGRDVLSYLSRVWAARLSLVEVERITVNGMPAATGQTMVKARGGGKANLRLVAIRFARDRIVRFMMLTPFADLDRLRPELQRTTFAFRRLGRAERPWLKPLRLRLVRYGPGDSIEALAAKLPLEGYKVARFRTLNGLGPNDRPRPGIRLKTVAE